VHVRSTESLKHSLRRPLEPFGSRPCRQRHLGLYSLNPESTMATDTLRTALRNQRRTLSDEEQRAAAQAVAKQLDQQTWFHSAKQLALYSASDGEISTHPLFQSCTARGSACLLPIIEPQRQMRWALWGKKSALVANRFGILEPASPRSYASLQSCQVIVVPLVGFDRSGNRVGMGAGYYDRALAEFDSERRAVFVGLAHSCQEVAKITPQAWDIPLDYIATERELICAKLK